MTTQDLILLETTIIVDGVPYRVAADVRGTCRTSHERFEHFGFRGSREECEVTVEVEGFSAFVGDDRKTEIEDRALLRKIGALLEVEADSSAVIAQFTFN